MTYTNIDTNQQVEVVFSFEDMIVVMDSNTLSLIELSQQNFNKNYIENI